MDIYGERKLAELLDKLSDIKQFEWIRLMYAFPADFPDDVLEVIANKPNICKYLDIPLQHISTKILKAMNRGIDKEGTIELIKRIREKVPGISLRTTFLVGYPGETQEDFDELIQFIKEMKFERVGCFVYSEEEGTPAYKIKDSIPSKIKNKRLDKLMLTQQRISLEHNRSLVGKELRVLIDDDIVDEEDAEELEEELCYSARTQSDAPEVDNAVIIYTENKLELGSFVNVRITEANEYDIYGEIIE